jgi:hypothetical protein
MKNPNLSIIFKNHSPSRAVRASLTEVGGRRPESKAVVPYIICGERRAGMRAGQKSETLKS